MNADYQFLEALRSSYKYSVDANRHPDNLEADELHMSAQEFISSLYVRRAIERTLIEKIVGTTDTICIVGPRHSGKTSTSVKVKTDIERADSRRFVVFVDARTNEYAVRLLRKLNKGDYSELETYIVELIKDIYLERLFPDKVISDNNPFYRLLEFVLQPYHPVDRPQELFNVLRPLRRDAEFHFG